jgi:hypothetical protein
MSQENVAVARRAVAFFVGLGGHIEADQAADRMPDSALQEFLDPEVELVPVAQGLLSGNNYRCARRRARPGTRTHEAADALSTITMRAATAAAAITINDGSATSGQLRHRFPQLAAMGAVGGREEEGSG